jgi:hypothetical protein
MGVAISLHGDVVLAQVQFERVKDAVVRMVVVQTCVRAILNQLCFDYPFFPLSVVIEGAGFEASQYRQVEMAENRTSIAQSLLDMGVKQIKFIAPNSIRKQVLGGGRIKAHDVWDNTEIPNDALAALSCMYYADMKEDEQ